MQGYRTRDQAQRAVQFPALERTTEPDSAVELPGGSVLRNDGYSLAWEMTLQGVEPAALILGILYFGLGITSVIVLPEFAWVLTPVALLTSGSLLVLHVTLRRMCWLGRSPHMLAGVVAGSVLVNSLLRLLLARDPFQTINLILLLVGAGFLFLSSRHLYAFIVITVGTWCAVVATIARGAALLEMTSWRQAGFGLVAAAGLSVILHISRIRGYQHLERLREATERHAEQQRQRAAHLESLISVGHSINTYLDLNVLLDQAVQTLHSCFGYDHVSVFLLDESGKRLVARAGTGEVGRRMVAERFALDVDGPGFVGCAATCREPVWSNTADQDSRYLKLDFLSTTRSEMTLPLAVGGTLLGVLDIQSARQHAFCKEDLRVCLSLADQIATAIVSTSRYEAEHARRALAESLYTVGRALSQTLNVSEVLNLILSSLGRLVAFDRGAVLLEKEGSLEIVSARGFPAASNPLQIRVPIRAGDVYEQIHDTKAPLIIPELGERSDWEYLSSLPRARSWVGLPLTDAEDIVIGMLSLTRQDVKPFTDDEVALGAALAGQAGAALHNARLYMELSAAYRQLARLDRAKSNFISLASHELRTPLTLVAGYAEMLAAEPLIQDTPAIANLVDGLVEGSDRLQEIVERMVDLAEIDSQLLSLSFAPVPLKMLLQLVVTGLEAALCERNQHASIDEASEYPDIEADANALAKVLRHLLVNAIKFTPDGGEITISSIVHPAIRNGVGSGSVELIVTDTGIGINPTDLERIFDKFYQTGEISLHSSGTIKFRGGGAGLGLAIVKGIVEAHHGSVWAESTGFDLCAYPGSSFHLLLPLLQRETSLNLNGLRQRMGNEFGSHMN
jgi:signal transduction histidine kinase/putative methionine-R-sulfoxide reductase with GAF domain